MSFRVVNPNKIRKMRKGRSLGQIAQASGGAFTRSALWMWEQMEGRHATTPTPEKIPFLLKALECEWDDISEPVKLETV
jgi:transcriptional regulator with XRE-family HTH domain